MTAPASDRSSILIVDDMQENLVALQAVLGPLDQHLVTARSGEEALKAMLRQDFALVLLDVLMPGMDGFETAGNIKRLDQTKDVPIILLTGTDLDPDYAYRGYALGAADFLAKPIDPWVLRTKVNVFLDLDRKKRQLAAQPGTEQLAHITEQLLRIETMLRDRDTSDSPELSARVAELERSIRRLEAGGDTGPRSEG
ncbi:MULTISPECIES: response regulator [unclassified Streptomyces]|uniref:response regulator n=1 Tax=unclassified Streptomyces TaxID=2593676 RepID=UPI002DDB3759|nr:MULTISPECIES: response regulator [unclassified Streptomyces]WSA95145.1 response regulator [Streptomyces sp. NBC_01795]WSB79567.1 response regulator [Streptomyces sp. NBC_01775]WSS12230.1 response regulator [Streptomyces sp. NBC_01186]WSS40943.1 response regulator [Streptomyces sp. NBC_01187]